MVVKLLIESLTNHKLSLIYMEVVRQGGDMTIHLVDIDHISGYYLLRFNREGMSKYKDVGTVDTPDDYISSIEIDTSGKLKIMGVDLV